MRKGLLIVLILGIAAAILLRQRWFKDQLLRSDPAAIPTNPSLLAFAALRGRSVFQTHCAACHGPEGRGDPSLGVPNLTDNDWLYGTGEVSDIEQVILYGIRSYNPKAWNLAVMPAFAKLHPTQKPSAFSALTPTGIEDVVEFLWSQQGHKADKAAVERGKAIFHGAGGCYDCHSEDAKGDSAIGAPNLIDSTTLYGNGSRRSLSMSISYGRAGICPAWTNRLSAAKIRETAVFVYTLSHPRGP